MSRRNSHPGCVGQWVRRCGMEHHPLLIEPAEESVGHLGNVLAAENADELVDLGTRFEERFALPFGQATGDDDAAELAAPFELKHLIDRGERFCAGCFDETARVDDRKIGAARIINELVTIELQQAEHSLAVHKVLRAAQADERVPALRRALREFLSESVYHVRKVRPRSELESIRGTHKPWCAPELRTTNSSERAAAGQLVWHFDAAIVDFRTLYCTLVYVPTYFLTAAEVARVQDGLGKNRNSCEFRYCHVIRDS